MRKPLDTSNETSHFAWNTQTPALLIVRPQASPSTVDGLIWHISLEIVFTKSVTTIAGRTWCIATNTPTAFQMTYFQNIWIQYVKHWRVASVIEEFPMTSNPTVPKALDFPSWTVCLSAWSIFESLACSFYGPNHIALLNVGVLVDPMKLLKTCTLVQRGGLRAKTSWHTHNHSNEVIGLLGIYPVYLSNFDTKV
jgi:hypothetical protein